ncbi:MAG TPA: hypothetical protein VK609_09875, partial [Mucilaginibacter sp.]|nr:hypothetical protein [Mucilaginibacter sp.]
KKTIAAKGQSIQVLNLTKNHGWYDFSIKVTGSQSFEKRYGGRVETGQHSFSDPSMGKVVLV